MNHTLITIRKDGSQWTEHCATTKEVFGSMSRQRSIAMRSSADNMPVQFVSITTADSNSTVITVYDSTGKKIGEPLLTSIWSEYIKAINNERERNKFKEIPKVC